MSSLKKTVQCLQKDEGAFHHLKLMKNSLRRQVLYQILAWTIETQFSVISKVTFLLVHFNMAKNIWFIVVKS